MTPPKKLTGRASDAIRGRCGASPRRLHLRGEGLLNGPRAASFTLLEMMLAIAIFSITVIGMIQGMNQTIRSSAMVTMASHVREQLSSRLVEARGRKLSGGMTATATDGRGVTYTTVAEPLKLRDRSGRELPFLYRLRLTAKWAGPAGPQTESVEEYVYQVSSTIP